MNTFLTLMKREWLQHRFGWTLLASVPLALVALVVAFGQIELGDDTPERLGDGLPVMVTLFSFAAAVGISMLLLSATSALLIAGLARRDHADRSHEFWLSLPAGHAVSVSTPLLVHAVLVPMAAVLVGVVAGLLISLIVVSRVSGLDGWLGLPWGYMLVAVAAGAGRLLAGVPLAVLWLAPLIGLVVLANALLKRWGLPALVAAFAVGSLLLYRLVGDSVLPGWLQSVFGASRAALIGARQGETDITIGRAADAHAFVADLPRLAGLDLAAALQQLWQPNMLIGLVIAAACFVALLQWRARSA